MKTKLLVALLLLLPLIGTAQTNSVPPAMPVEEIIRQFAAKEKAFKLARENYIYRQTVKVLDLGTDGETVHGKYETTEDILFSAQGRRIEKVVYAPVPTLQNFGMTSEDLRDLHEIQPFVLTSDEIGKYNVRYMGRQKVDELDTYMFFVSPKAMEKGQRYFQGQIWVDDRDLQIVKTFGKAVPDLNVGKKEKENIFPRFETYREQIDGKYWFPTYTKADDTLNFSSGPIHIRETVKYENYKMFRTATSITFGGEAPEKKPDENKKPDKPY